jgi:glutathione S-transferase
MIDLADFPITKKWPAEYPERIQLYSLPTPNGIKVAVMLEETGLPYEPHLVRFDANRRLAGRSWIMGEAYTIADMALFPWINTLQGFYGAGELVGITDFPQVIRVLKAFLERPAVVRGVDIPKRI